MAQQIALLRGINVGGNKLVAMGALREMFGALGFLDARSLLQSGNVVFGGGTGTGGLLEEVLERESAGRFGWPIDYFVRSVKEWERIVAGNPFVEEAERDPGHLVVTFLKKAVTEKEVAGLREAFAGPENIRAEGRQLYVVYPAGIGRSKLTLALMERKLGTRGTARNWNTVLKLAAMVRG